MAADAASATSDIGPLQAPAAAAASSSMADANKSTGKDGDVGVDVDGSMIPEPMRELMPATLSRLAAGLPLHELDIIIKEAKACEDALEREIETLEAEIGINSGVRRKSSGDDPGDDDRPSSPLTEPTMISIPLLPRPYQPGGEPGKGHVNYLSSVDEIIETEFAPPDRYFTVSALLGRLRDPMKLPHPPNSHAARAAASRAGGGGPGRGRKAESPEQEERRKAAALEKQRALLALEKNVIYHKEQQDTAALLTLYKKISMHRTAAVFRKPVGVEAPGYKERILFPMDLSLVRKMIVAGMIKSFSSFHQRVALICHNCVKFNGRESDYAVITRDFEDNVDDKVLEAVKNATAAAAAAAARAAALPPAATSAGK